MQNKYSFLKYWLCCIFMSAAFQVSAQKTDTTNAFLDNFDNFVKQIENCDSTIDWTKANAQYKDFRTEFKTVYKNKMRNDQYVRYNEIKARYITQVSKKKVGRGINKKLTNFSSAIKGAVDGVFDKK